MGMYPAESNSIEEIYSFDGELTTATSFNYKFQVLDKSVIQKYKYLILELYDMSLSNQVQAVTSSFMPVSELLKDDGQYRSIRTAMNNQTYNQSYLVWVLNYNGNESRNDIEFRFLDYTKTLTKGKAVLYGIK